MVGIRNKTMLKVSLGFVMDEVIESVSKDILSELRGNIEKHVYHDVDANTVYKPTYEFIDAFKWDDIKKTTFMTVRKMFYDYQKMGFDANMWMHGSFDGDARANLADILNVKGFTSDLWIAKKVKPYWDITIKQLFHRNKISRWIDKELKAAGRIHGFKVKKIR